MTRRVLPPAAWTIVLAFAAVVFLFPSTTKSTPWHGTHRCAGSSLTEARLSEPVAAFVHGRYADHLLPPLEGGAASDVGDAAFSHYEPWSVHEYVPTPAQVATSPFACHVEEADPWPFTSAAPASEPPEPYAIDYAAGPHIGFEYVIDEFPYNPIADSSVTSFVETETKAPGTHDASRDAASSGASSDVAAAAEATPAEPAFDYSYSYTYSFDDSAEASNADSAPSTRVAAWFFPSRVDRGAADDHHEDHHDNRYDYRFEYHELLEELTNDPNAQAASDDTVEGPASSSSSMASSDVCDFDHPEGVDSPCYRLPLTEVAAVAGDEVASAELTEADRALITALDLLDAPTPGSRRTIFRGYVESLGAEAVSFATLCKKHRSLDVFGFAAGANHVTTFLSIFRLIEAGRLDAVDAAAVLQARLWEVD